MLKNKFLKNIITLITGTSAGQLLLLLLSPLLTRLYSAEDFGAFGVFISASSILLVIACLKYEMALPIVKVRSTAIVLVKLCLLLIVIVSGVAAIIIWVFDDFLAQLLNLNQQVEILYLLPIALLACGAYQLANFYSVRESLFNRLSVSKVVQASAVGAGQVALSFITTLGLIYGYVVGFIISLFCFAPLALGKSKTNQVTILKMLAVAKRYSNFPKFTMWASLTNTSSTMLPVILFSSLYSASQAGLYVLAHRVLIAPVNIIGSAISNVFMSNARQYLTNGELAGKTLAIHRQLVNLAMPIMALFVFYLGDIFAWVFGRQWAPAGQLSSFLAIWIYFVFTASPISTVLIVLEKQKLAAVFDMFSFVLRITAVLSLAYLPFVDAILYFSLLNGCIVSCFIFMTFKQLKIDAICVAQLHVSAALTYLLPSAVIYYCLQDTKSIAFSAAFIWIVIMLVVAKRVKKR